MTSERQRALAAAFSKQHRHGPIVVIPNAFDAGSARIFARHQPVALGTSSGGIAWAAGRPDGETLTREEMLAAVARIVSAVDVGVTADVEAGYGDAPEDAAVTAEGVIECGAIGLNIEDSGSAHGNRPGQLLEPDAMAAKVAAARNVAERAKIELVLNARTDVFLVGAGDDESERIALAVERGNAYLNAGADCVFVPGAASTDALSALVRGIRGPVNAYVVPGLPSIAELDRLGIRRVSIGGGPYQACLALLETIAAELFGEGKYEQLLARQLPFADVQQRFATHSA